MHKSTLTLSMTFLLVALAGALVLVGDLWLKNAESEAQIDPVAIASLSGRAIDDAPTVDGQITEGEYAHKLTDEVTRMTLYWSLIGDRIFLGLTSPGAGWLALGLDPDGPMMRGADILIGYIQDGQVSVQDHFGDLEFCVWVAGTARVDFDLLGRGHRICGEG